MTHMDHGGNVIDGTTGIAAITAPFWLQFFEVWAQGLITAGGLVLIGFRIVAAWRDATGRRRRNEAGDGR
jgi:hypothetical protein